MDILDSSANRIGGEKTIDEIFSGLGWLTTGHHVRIDRALSSTTASLTNYTHVRIAISAKHSLREDCVPRKSDRKATTGYTRDVMKRDTVFRIIYLLSALKDSSLCPPYVLYIPSAFRGLVQYSLNPEFKPIFSSFMSQIFKFHWREYDKVQTSRPAALPSAQPRRPISTVPVYPNVRAKTPYHTLLRSRLYFHPSLRS